jgi:hypothetical protein
MRVMDNAVKERGGNPDIGEDVVPAARGCIPDRVIGNNLQ